jgi:hypothetical protein
MMFVLIKGNITGAITGVGTAYLSGAPEFTSGFSFVLFNLYFSM